jgi:3alpha(or 20beta)-hydroxysteroid dehydrogenase
MTTESGASTNSSKVALITGGARGQGAAHAWRLASDGAVVYIADVLDEIGQAEADRLRGQGLDVTYLHLDISDEDSWQTAMTTIKVQRGRLDVLVNNAGVIHVTPIAQEDLTAWRRLLDINLTGAFLGIRAAFPLLEASAVARSSTSRRSSVQRVRSATPHTPPAKPVCSVLLVRRHWSWRRRTFASTLSVPEVSAPR